MTSLEGPSPDLGTLLSLLAERWPRVGFSLEVTDRGVVLGWRNGPADLDGVPDVFGVRYERTLTWEGVAGELVDHLTHRGSLETLDVWELMASSYVRSPSELGGLVPSRVETTLSLYASSGLPPTAAALRQWLEEHWGEVCTLAAARPPSLPGAPDPVASP